MKKISIIEYISCFITLFCSSFLGIGLYSFIKYKGNLLSILLSLIISILFIYIFITIFKYEPKYNIKEKLSILFNKKLSILFSLILCICLLFIGITLSYDFNNFVISQFLSETPIYIIASIFCSLYFYINSKGYEVILRVSSITFFINILLIIFLLLCNIKGFNLSNIKISNFNLTGSFYLISIPIPLISILLLIPKNKIDNRITKHIVISLIISFLYILLHYILTIGILGDNLSNLYQYPFYISLKNISFINVFDRIENLIIIEWIFQIFITISFIINYISKILKINHLIINILLTLFTIFFYKNNTFFYQFTLSITPYILFTILFISIIIFIQIKRKLMLSKLHIS